MKIILPILCGVLFIGCSHPMLQVRSEYFSRKELAASQVDAPDPRKESDNFGQRLCINWNVPNEVFNAAPVDLVLKVRLKNGEEKDTKIRLTKPNGATFYPIFGNDYFKKGGLATYWAGLQTQGKFIVKSRHKLWVKKIVTDQK